MDIGNDQNRLDALVDIFSARTVENPTVKPPITKGDNV